ncbi:MAG: hypothetical protein KF874_02390 [Rhizobiaceae bacterium]|nr:hypothetical protein [Rhizobiaceae bacterium]
MRADKLLWIVLGALAIAAILLMFNDSAGNTFGIDNNTFASFVYLGSLALVIGAGVAARARFGGNLLSQTAIWLAVILALVVGYKLYHGEPLFERDRPLPPNSGAGISASLVDGVYGGFHLGGPRHFG